MSEPDSVSWQDGQVLGRPFDKDGEFGPPPEQGQLGPNRRDFLRLAGFALAGTAFAGCQRASRQDALPYLEQPEGVVAGRSYYYASVCGGCSAGCGVLVKNRDGRPIKLEGNPDQPEGNPDQPLSRGGLCAAGQASILGLYDSQRLTAPMRGDQPAEWTDVDQAIRSQLQAVRNDRRAVYFLTGSLVSPTTRAHIQRFLETFADSRPQSRHVVHDARSNSAIMEAHFRTHGVRVLPHYLLDRAEVIVSFDADFLGTWISPVEFTAAYQGRRRPDSDPPRMSYHVQFESRLSLTGSKADQRVVIRPGELGLILSHLATRLAARAREDLPAERLEEPPLASQFLEHLTEVLWRKRRQSLVLCGSRDPNEQVLANYLNHILENYAATVDLARPSYQSQDNHGDLEDFQRELRQPGGRVGAVFIYQCNPVHDLPGGEALAELLRRVPLVVALAERKDESARLAHFVCPVPHYLESWSDAEPVNGIVSLVQPAITPLGNTRSVLESLATWMGSPQSGRATRAYDLLRSAWETEVYPRHLGSGTFEAFWNRTLHDGVAHVAPRPLRADLPALAATVAGSLSAAEGQGPMLAASVLAPSRADRLETFNVREVRLIASASRPPEGTYSVVLYSKVGMLDSSHAYNPWLQELPDPISKVAWDNYACLSPEAANQLGVVDGDVVRLEPAGQAGELRELELPAFVQPGQHDEVVAVALGYGSTLSERFAQIGPPWLEARLSVGDNGQVGKNAAPLLAWTGGVRLTKTDRHHDLASTQGYHRLTVPPQLALAGQERRPIIRETTLEAFRQEHGRRPLAVVAGGHQLWPDDHDRNRGTRWGMVIDHNACTGCSACVIACQAENNIPVVGKDEVRRHREMHWLRIDRYYADVPPDPALAREGERQAGVDVVHQPMLCQHCGNAPCEPVCPVLATVHSSEGLNQQIYNRCVGTRYCANNCPYKVRRFNWFDYAHDDTLANLVLNPDVTVRSRGVMEKCTFCVQRIQEARSEASSRGLLLHPLQDGDVQTACQQSCPAQAILFGNLNGPSRVAWEANSPRSYQVLEQLNVQPSVHYLTLVRNRPAIAEGQRHGER
jgi:molybdopterin-containing oxidoreductase family iron-sulfur binding subunit